jgi:glycosyltransferase involved in cell wall biosynthesis
MSGTNKIQRRFRLIVSAYACEPGVGSEPEVGWRWVQELARFHDVWVLTRANNRKAISEAQLETTLPNLHFEYVDLPKWLRFWKRKNRGIHLYYFLWQIIATMKALFLHWRYRFEICHHLTFSAFYKPPLFALLPIPFMWGPIGGGEKLNHSFLPIFTLLQKLREYLRSAIRILSPFNPLVRFAFWRARLIIVATRETLQVIPVRYHNRALYEAQIGMLPKDPSSQMKQVSNHFRVVTAGRHVYWKGIILAIRGFARFLQENRIPSELKIIGRGPETPKLMEEVKRLGVQDHVIFTSHLPTLDAVFSAFRSSDVFVYASLLECAGYVVLEALAQGTPVLCLDLPGPGEIVDESCGIKIPAVDPDSVVLHLSRALSKIATDSELRLRLSAGAIKRVNTEFNWGVKGNRLQQELLASFS